MKKSCGRPKKSIDEKRSISIKFSCTKNESDFLKKHAEAAGYKQIANFLHKLFLKIVSEGKFTYIEQHKFNREFIYEFTRMANIFSKLILMVDQSNNDNLTACSETKEILLHLCKMMHIALESTEIGTEKKLAFTKENNKRDGK